MSTIQQPTVHPTTSSLSSAALTEPYPIEANFKRSRSRLKKTLYSSKNIAREEKDTNTTLQSLN